MEVELTRFRIKSGKEKKVDEWLHFLNENMAEVLLTLADEKMYVETIFREQLGKHQYLYWYSVQGANGQAVEESKHWVDQKHLEYWQECIDTDYVPVDLQTEVVMIQETFRQQMK
ncbi:DUF6176 family protein [Caldibacillus lycopersici]|uniref:DUF6176 family protein n=1 Tax=Perspicuibacillus lycopersici TaxID=1325689 RepID=A0AAE3LQI4_9BACI|nr:DUF6176 family protein [Perspicuibacillus lycopersici]MCU9613539.1 DUF6176 family protein [Perspicuibacillus lycopersici]